MISSRCGVHDARRALREDTPSMQSQPRLGNMVLSEMVVVEDEDQSRGLRLMASVTGCPKVTPSRTRAAVRRDLPTTFISPKKPASSE